MKFLNKCLLIGFISIFTMSCSDVLELDEFLTNPNAVSEENAGIDFIYNSIQQSYNNFQNNMHFIADGFVRYTTLGAFTYTNATPPTLGNGAWTNAYANVFPDVDALLNIATESGLTVHAGSAKVMKAAIMLGLVDLFGDVVWTDAGKGTDVIAPGLDDGASVYAAAVALLDEAIGDLDGSVAARPAVDIFYGGDPAKWVTLAKTLKLKAAATTRLVDSGAGGTISSIVSGGDFIDDASEDFQFQYGTERNNPNSRHPFYNNSYENSDGAYMGNYFMWQMCCANEVEDPRLRYYFYRQQSFSIGHDPNAYSCIFTEEPTAEDILATYPAHYTAVDPNLPYCVPADNGYYGRDHGNGSGIPPDGPIRTVYGVYPGGGRFDNNSFDFTQNQGVDGGLGAGVNPILISSTVDFLRAEAAAAGATSEDARAMLESAVRKSISKVLSFSSLVPSADQSFVYAVDPITGEELTGASLFASADDVEEYVADMLARYDASSDKMDVIMTEFFIGSYGNAMEFYNAYRRTGKPNNFQPGIDNQSMIPGSEGFPRSILLPSTSVNLNSNISQKGNVTEPVFWDNGSAVLR